MSVRIPYTEGQNMSYYDFDLMMSVNAGRHNLMEGKTIQTGTRNGIILFFEGILLMVIASMVHWLFPDLDPIFTEVLSAFGLVIIFVDLVFSGITRNSYRKMLAAGDIKADVVFDEYGIHAWETPGKGFDAGWNSVTNCFITKKWIYILFKNRNIVVDLPYTRENKELVIAGMKEGHQLQLIKFLAVERGKITVRNK